MNPICHLSLIIYSQVLTTMKKARNIFNQLPSLKMRFILAALDMLGGIAFFSFCMATIFMVFFSTMILEIGPKPWNKIIVLLACLIPLSMVIVWKIRKRKNWHVDSTIMLYFIPLIIIFGLLNIIFSEDRFTSFKIMTLFFLSGISVFFVSSVLFENRNFQSIFLWMCWASLVVLCIYGIYEYFDNKPIFVFSYNPILASALLLLLLVGPFVLIYENPNWLKAIFLISIIFGVAVIIIIGKRGAALGLVGMGLSLFALLQKRKLWVLLIVLGLLGTGWMARYHLSNYFPKGYFQSGSFVYRLENYPFAWHIFKKHPIFGVGLHAPLVKYLNDYDPKTSVSRADYVYYIKTKYTLENLFLCGFVEAGSLFTLTYIAFILYLLRRYWQVFKSAKYGKFHAALFLSPMIAFGVQAMTFDGLINGHLNWLFHSYLGLMTSFKKT